MVTWLWDTGVMAFLQQETEKISSITTQSDLQQHLIRGDVMLLKVVFPY